MTQADHPHMEAARMEAAVEVLGVKIARIGDAIAAEKAKNQPNAEVMDQLMAQLRELRDLQDDLLPGDPRIANIRLD